MTYAVKQTVAPTRLPLDTYQLREHCHIADWDRHHDQYLRGLLAVATEMVERETNRQLITATFELQLDRLPAGREPLCIPRAPLVSVTSLVRDSVAIDLTSYRVDTRSEPGRLLVPTNVTWTANTRDVHDIVLTYTAGYGTTVDSVPSGLRHALLLLVGHWFENREASSEQVLRDIPLGVQRLLANHSVGDEWVDYASG